MFKFTPKKPLNREIVMYIVIAIILLVFFWYISSIWSGVRRIVEAVSPFFWGITIAYVLNVLMSFLERVCFEKLARKNRFWQKMKRPLSLICTFLIVAGVLTLVIVVVAPKFGESIMTLVSAFPAYWESFSRWAETVPLMGELERIIGDKWAEISPELPEYVTDKMKTFAPYLYDVTSGIFTTIFHAVIGFIFALYMLIEKEKLVLLLRKLCRSILNEKSYDVLDHIAAVTNRCFKSFICGQCIEAVILGTLTYLGMLILGLPYALIIGVLVGVTSVIPVVGAWFGTIPGAFLLLVIDPVDALIFIIFIVVLQQIEGHVIYPNVVGKSVSLSAVWVLLAIVLGGALGGVIGMLITVPLFSTIGTLAGEYIDFFLRKKRAAGEKVAPELITVEEVISKTKRKRKK